MDTSLVEEFARWHDVILAGIAAASGLLGVLVGGWMTGRNQRIERAQGKIRERLIEFYSPLRGMRCRIRAKSELRSKLHGAANAAWTELFGGVHDPTAKAQIDRDKWPAFEALINYSDQQLTKELIPLYKEMLDHFSNHMGLAEESTLAYYNALVEFVEIWERWLAKSIPHEVLAKIVHSEEQLAPFYDDIERHFLDLSKRLHESSF